ncbi:MAG: extracellular solute-binding protein [Hyphomicrobiales bacterium]|nr:extracellular solute-binding protein [Hyphomicrobiales bacterium]
MVWIGVIGEIGRRGAKTVAACLCGLTLIAGISGPVAQTVAQDMAQDVAQDLEWHRGLSLFGSLKYEPGFAHFDYVDPQAPKGGTARLYTIGTFDSLNPFTFKGRPAGLIGLIHETLMTPSLDEPSSEYELLAEAVTYPQDFSSVTYRLNAEARWHDGVPVGVDDVIFSLAALKKSHPFYAAYYKNIVKAEKTGEREVTFTFDQAGNRELPQITGQLPILPKHWWTTNRPDGTPREVGESTLEVPLGSGPYRVGEVKPGRSIAIARVDDYWGKDLPVNVGQNNFDEIRLEYFRDDTIALEAFKGDQYDWRPESSAKNWATAYDFPAVKRSRVVLEKFHLENAETMQAFAFNIRRDKFQDPRVRRAFNLAFDFEWANKNLFYGEYVRTNSYFANSELAATGLPGPEELEILSPIKDQVPPEVFTEEYENPVNGSPGEQRANLRMARDLLAEAGWEIRDGALANSETGAPMEVEFLLVSPTFERIVLPYVQSLGRLGIKAGVRTVDASQYQSRLDTFDFDIVVANWQQSLSPGNEQRDFWGSAAADRNGSRNLVGIKNEAIDHLIDKIIFAKDREELVAACRALDRVLLWNHYVVPQWHVPYDRIARWDRFGRPGTMPDYSIGFPTIWWWDEAKAAAVATAK